MREAKQIVRVNVPEHPNCVRTPAAWGEEVLRCPNSRTVRVRGMDIVVRPCWPWVSKIPNLFAVAAASLRDLRMGNVRVEVEGRNFLPDFQVDISLRLVAEEADV